jgi:hypothetical protein
VIGNQSKLRLLVNGVYKDIGGLTDVPIFQRTRGELKTGQLIERTMVNFYYYRMVLSLLSLVTKAFQHLNLLVNNIWLWNLRLLVNGVYKDIGGLTDVPIFQRTRGELSRISYEDGIQKRLTREQTGDLTITFY